MHTKKVTPIFLLKNLSREAAVAWPVPEEHPGAGSTNPSGGLSTASSLP